MDPVYTQWVSSLISKFLTTFCIIFLEPWEQVKADAGYVRHPDKIKCPQNVGNLAENWVMQEEVRACHETLNKQLKIGGSSHRSTTTTSCGTLSVPGVCGGDAAHHQEW